MVLLKALKPGLAPLRPVRDLNTGRLARFPERFGMEDAEECPEERVGKPYSYAGQARAEFGRVGPKVEIAECADEHGPGVFLWRGAKGQPFPLENCRIHDWQGETWADWGLTKDNKPLETYQHEHGGVTLTFYKWDGVDAPWVHEPSLGEPVRARRPKKGYSKSGKKLGRPPKKKTPQAGEEVLVGPPEPDAATSD